jgi:hypothetical protein
MYFLYIGFDVLTALAVSSIIISLKLVTISQELSVSMYTADMWVVVDLGRRYAFGV